MKLFRNPLLLAPALLAAAPALHGQSMAIERADLNMAIGDNVNLRYYTALDLAGSGLLPFNPAQGHWDFSAFTGGGNATIEIIDPAGTPYAGTYPNATICERQNIPGTSVAYFYERLTPDGLVADGFGTNQLGININANFSPDWRIYQTPMSVGDSVTQTFTWSYRVLVITVTVTEVHNAEVVAEGTVRVPGVPYDMPCLVMREFVTVNDNLGTSDNFWGYYWLTPGGFAGANGVVSLQSQTNAGSLFTQARNAFFLSSSNLTPESAPRALSADARSISQSSGGTITFSLDGGLAHSGRDYLLAASGSGTWPGAALPGGATIPLNQDGVTSWFLANANGATLPGFRGTLDGVGQATAQITAASLPPSALGLRVTFAWTTENPYDFQSNNEYLLVTP